MKNFLKFILFILGFAFVFTGIASMFYSLAKLLSKAMDIDYMNIFYFLLIPNFFLTMFTIMEMDKMRHKKKNTIIALTILFLILNLKFLLLNFRYIIK